MVNLPSNCLPDGLSRSDLSSHHWNAATKRSFLVITPITVEPQMQPDHLGDGFSSGGGSSGASRDTDWSSFILFVSLFVL